MFPSAAVADFVPGPEWPKVLAFALAAVLSGTHASGAGAGVHTDPRTSGYAVDMTSQFSHLRVKNQGSTRTLLFVRDNGEEVEESKVNLRQPQELLLAYARFMFASYLFCPKQERVAIIGLGGGGMVHFLKHYDPRLVIDAVEIDPAVVEVADKYFDLRTAGNVHVFTADGVQFLEGTDNRYDVVYMDAFLRPSEGTDRTGLPLTMKKPPFYKTVQSKLRPGGLVVFNLNRSNDTTADLALLRKQFATLHVFRPSGGNIVVMALPTPQITTTIELKNRGQELDRRFHASFSFRELVSHMGP